MKELVLMKEGAEVAFQNNRYHSFSNKGNFQVIPVLVVYASLPVGFLGVYFSWIDKFIDGFTFHFFQRVA